MFYSLVMKIWIHGNAPRDRNQDLETQTVGSQGHDAANLEVNVKKLINNTKFWSWWTVLATCIDATGRQGSRNTLRDAEISKKATENVSDV